MSDIFSMEDAIHLVLLLENFVPIVAPTASPLGLDVGVVIVSARGDFACMLLIGDVVDLMLAIMLLLLTPSPRLAACMRSIIWLLLCFHIG